MESQNCSVISVFAYRKLSGSPAGPSREAIKPSELRHYRSYKLRRVLPSSWEEGRFLRQGPTGAFSSDRGTAKYLTHSMAEGQGGEGNEKLERKRIVLK